MPLAFLEMLPVDDGNEYAIALYKHSLHLIPLNNDEYDLDRITKAIQALYAALESVTVPSIEATIRKRLAQILESYTEEYKEISFQYEKASMIYEQLDDFKFDLFDKITSFHQYCTLEKGIVRNSLELVIKQAKDCGARNWLFYFQCKKIRFAIECGNLNETTGFLRQLHDEYKNDHEFVLILLCLEYCSLIQLDRQLIKMKQIHTKITQLHSQFAKPLKFIFVINMFQFLLEGNVQDATMERQKYANFLVQNSANINEVKFPLSLIDSDIGLQSLLFSALSAWIDCFVCAKDFELNNLNLREKILIKYQDCISVAKRTLLYDLLIFVSLIGRLEEQDFTELFFICIQKENSRNLDLIICKYSTDNSFLQSAPSLHSFTLCKTFLKNLSNSIKTSTSIDTANLPYLAPVKLFQEGMAYLYGCEEHKAKYKFFEALKLSNGPFQNTTYKCLSLVGLGFIYLKSDLSQAYKVLHSAYSLAVKITNPKLLVFTKTLLKDSIPNK